MAKICVLGLGYIGLPTALLFATNGHEVVGVDINTKVVELLNKGKAHFDEKGIQELLTKTLSEKKFRASTKVEDADAFLICVQTPLDKNYNIADLEYVKVACNMVVPFLKKGNIVVIESTISPGSTEILFRNVLEKSGLQAGVDFYLAHCPEKAMPGKTLDEMINNHRIIGGLAHKDALAAKKLYLSFVEEKKFFCTDLRTAEIVKIIENTYRDLNIAVANEFAMICEELKINVWEAIRLANMHPRVNILKPGPGVGGHCIAIDPWFLTEVSMNSQLIQTARRINDSMPNFTVMLTKQLLGDDTIFPTVTVFGVSYKGNVDDTRESPALKYIHLAKKQGMTIKIHDPLNVNFEGGELLSLEESVKDSDIIVLITDHNIFRDIDPTKIAPLMKQKYLLDTRNFLDHKKWTKAGFTVKILGDNKK